MTGPKPVPSSSSVQKTLLPTLNFVLQTHANYGLNQCVNNLKVVAHL
jgi:hypothetical protein